MSWPVDYGYEQRTGGWECLRGDKRLDDDVAILVVKSQNMLALGGQDNLCAPHDYRLLCKISYFYTKF